MKRYQIYLEPDNMQFLANLSQDMGVSRSRIIQDIVDSLASRYKALTISKKLSSPSILDMAGVIKTKEKTTYSSTKPDSDYFGV